MIRRGGRGGGGAAAAVLCGLVACGAPKAVAPTPTPSTAVAPKPTWPAGDEPVLGRALPPREKPSDQAVEAAATARLSAWMTAPSLQSVRPHFEAAEQAIEAQRWAVAERALDAVPKNAAAAHYLQLARIQLAAAKQGWPTQLGHGEGDARIERAVADLRSWGPAVEPPLRGLVQLELGRWCVVLGDAEAASAALGAALTEQTPPLQQVAEVQSLFGLTQLALGRIEAALAPLQRAAALEPEEPARHGNLGTAFILNGLVREAVRAYQKRVQLAPDDAQAHADLGVALSQVGEPTAGARALQRAVALAPQRASYRANLGYALLRSGARAEARTELERALQLEPNSLVALLGLSGWHAATPSGWKDADRWLRKAEQIAPDDPRVTAARSDLQQLSTPARRP